MILLLKLSILRLIVFILSFLLCSFEVRFGVCMIGDFSRLVLSCLKCEFVIFAYRIEHKLMTSRLQKRTETKRTRASEDDRSSRSSSSTTNSPEESEISNFKNDHERTSIENVDVLSRLQKDHSEEVMRADIFSENTNSIERLHPKKVRSADNQGAPSNISNKIFENRLPRLHESFETCRDSVNENSNCFEGRQKCANSTGNFPSNLNQLENDQQKEELRDDGQGSFDYQTIVENDTLTNNQPKNDYHNSDHGKNEFLSKISKSVEMKEEFCEEVESKNEERDTDKERLKRFIQMETSDNVRDALIAHKIASEGTKNDYKPMDEDVSHAMDYQGNGNSSETSRSSSVSREISETNSEPDRMTQMKYNLHEEKFSQMNIGDENLLGGYKKSDDSVQIMSTNKSDDSDRENRSSDPLTTLIQQQNEVIQEKESLAQGLRRHQEIFPVKDSSDDNSSEKEAALSQDHLGKHFLRKEDTADNFHRMNLRKSEDRRNITIKRLSQQRKKSSEIGLRSRRNHKRLTEPSVESSVEGDSPDSGQPVVSTTRNKSKGVKTNGRLTRSQRRGHQRSVAAAAAAAEAAAAVAATADVGVADDDSGIQGDIYEFNEKESNLEDVEVSAIRRSRHSDRQSVSPESRLQLSRNNEEFGQLQPPALVPEDPWPRGENAQLNTTENWERKDSHSEESPGSSAGSHGR